MPTASDLLSTPAFLRVDGIAIVAATFVACAICRSQVRRRGGTLSRSACGWLIAASLVGVLLLGWIVPIPGSTPNDGPGLMMRRALGLGIVAVVTGGGIIAAGRVALLRAELRGHAEAGRQLRHARATAEDASRAKRDFLAVMSHEIRTPLNAVLGFATLLAEGKLEEPQRGYVHTILGEGARLSTLIDDILDLTRIEEGRLVLERVAFAPADIVRDILRLVGPRAAEKKIDLRFEAQIAGPLLVAGDPARFRQLLVNLIDNAVKFTPRGAITVFMTWTPPAAPAVAGHLAVRVCDTGIGIPPARLPDLFQLFMQADTSPSRRYGGTGLGLALSQRLASLMGGRIEVCSTQGEGSEFSFTLALPPFSAPERPAAAPPELAAPRARTPRILVVDDMETNRFLLEIFLRRHGFDPELAAGGEEAVRLARATRYDAILMDLQMPDIDGYTATKRIRSAETAGGRRTPIIALTASFARGTREKCLEAGMDEHLTKPLDLRRFTALLNTFIGPA